MAAEKYVKTNVRESDYLALRKLADAMPGGTSITKMIAILVDSAVRNGVNYSKETSRPAPPPKPTGAPKIVNGKVVRTQYEREAMDAYNLFLSAQDKALGAGLGDTAYEDLPAVVFAALPAEERWAKALAWYETNPDYAQDLLGVAADMGERLSDLNQAIRLGMEK